MLMVDGEGTPISVLTTSAITSEAHTIETIGDTRTTKRTPERLQYDKAADADWLREQLEGSPRGVDLPAPRQPITARLILNQLRIARINRLDRDELRQENGLVTSDEIVSRG